MISRRLAALAAVPVLGFGLAACQPNADPESCRGTIGAVTVEKVIVPQGATCTLDGTRVQSDVLVKSDATLVARGATIGGNVQAENHREVRISSSSTVGGSIQVKQGGPVSVRSTSVAGDIQYDANRGPLEAVGNRVNGSIQIVGNTGSNLVRDNRVGGNLQCKENSPAPTGGGNVVQGNKEDQCARL